MSPTQQTDNPNSYTIDQVALHSSPEDLWIILDNEVYNVTLFLQDHPGGKQVLAANGGKDVSEIFRSPTIHRHSGFARKLLDKYRIGTLVGCENELKGGKKTCSSKIKDQEFLDLSLPLVPQMWSKSFSKNFYLEQVHLPRHLEGPARFFKFPILEMLTRTPWWAIPLIWIPVTILMINLSQLTRNDTVGLYGLGLVLWTLFEYVFHRFLFHMDGWLPDSQVAFTIHFLLHGVHHFLPMDQYRLVMPPIMFATLASSVMYIFSWIIPLSEIFAIGSGLISGYILYDLVHYYFHHGTPITHYIRMMKSHHMDHHYLNHSAGFGVSNKLWDVVFATTIKKNPIR